MRGVYTPSSLWSIMWWNINKVKVIMSNSRDILGSHISLPVSGPTGPEKHQVWPGFEENWKWCNLKEPMSQFYHRWPPPPDGFRHWCIPQQSFLAFFGLWGTTKIFLLIPKKHTSSEKYLTKTGNCLPFKYTFKVGVFHQRSNMSPVTQITTLGMYLLGVNTEWGST